jgi:hypothetical protein
MEAESRNETRECDQPRLSLREFNHKGQKDHKVRTSDWETWPQETQRVGKDIHQERHEHHEISENQFS